MEVKSSGLESGGALTLMDGIEVLVAHDGGVAGAVLCARPDHSIARSLNQASWERFVLRCDGDKGRIALLSAHRTFLDCGEKDGKLCCVKDRSSCWSTAELRRAHPHTHWTVAHSTAKHALRLRSPFVGRRVFVVTSHGTGLTSEGKTKAGLGEQWEVLDGGLGRIQLACVATGGLLGVAKGGTISTTMKQSAEDSHPDPATLWVARPAPSGKVLLCSCSVSGPARHLQCAPDGSLSLHENALTWERFSLVDCYWQPLQPERFDDEAAGVAATVTGEKKGDSKGDSKHADAKPSDGKDSAAPRAGFVSGKHARDLVGAAVDRKRWRLVWADEFGGNELNENHWTVEGMSDPPNNELQYYTTRKNHEQGANVFMRDSALVIEARREKFGAKEYTSARLKTQHKVDFLFGRFEARMKLPRGTGLWPAFWMLGSTIDGVGWPACGEIDIMEGKGRLTKFTSGAVHRGPSPDRNWIDSRPHWLPEDSKDDLHNEWHTYSVEWEPTEIRWFLDHTHFHTVNRPHPSDAEHALNGLHYGAAGHLTGSGELRLDKSRSSDAAGFFWPFNHGHGFFLLLNVAVGGWFDVGHSVDDSALPGRLLVSHVRVYQQDS